MDWGSLVLVWVCASLALGQDNCEVIEQQNRNVLHASSYSDRDLRLRNEYDTSLKRRIPIDER